MTRIFVLGAVTCALLLPALPALARWEGRVIAQDSTTYPEHADPGPDGYRVQRSDTHVLRL